MLTCGQIIASTAKPTVFLSAARHKEQHPPSKFPFSLPYSGAVGRDSGASTYQGTSGTFWSSGTSSAIYARRLDFYDVNALPEAGSYKTSGLSVHYTIQKTKTISILHQNSHSRFRTQATSIAITALMSIRVRTASSGRVVLIPPPTLGLSTSTASASGRSTTTARPTAFLSAAPSKARYFLSGAFLQI